MKTTYLLTSILITAFFSFNALAEYIHLDEAKRRTEAATKLEDGEAVARIATEAKTHAILAKIEKQPKVDNKHMDKGIKCLDDAGKEGNDGNTDAAHKAARDALNHFKQAAK